MAGASQTSLLWQKNGGWFKTSKGDANEVECLFEGTDDAEACGRLMKLHNSNMWKHLLDVHGVTKDDVRRRIAEQSKGGIAPEPLFKRAAGEFRSSVAAPGLGLKSPNFEHASVAEELGAFKVFVSELPKCEDLPLLAVCGAAIRAQKFPRIVHLALWHMGLPATNAPSESLWSDMGHLSDGKRNRISEDHLSVEVEIKRNYDLVKYLRQQIGCKPTETLEQAQQRWEKGTKIQ
jgi:hypothetical protein